jgi:hypothetical protein
MWYLILHATDLSFCPGLKPRRAPADGGRSPVRRCLSRAALPDRAGQRVRSRGAAECAPSRVQRTNRAQCRACLQCLGRGVSAARILPTPYHARALGERGRPAAPGLVAPQSSHLRLPHQAVDLREGGRGQFCSRPHSPADQPRNDPQCPAALGGELAAGQALDYQSRRGLCPKKQARDRLIRWTASHPEWVLGFEDEPWWSRLAQPALHAWTPECQPLWMIEQTVPRSDPAPKALAC